MHTQRAKIHEAGEGDDPEVHGIDYMTTIDQWEKPVTLDTGVSERALNRELTRTPSANQPFKLQEVRVGGVSWTYRRGFKLKRLNIR